MPLRDYAFTQTALGKSDPCGTVIKSNPDRPMPKLPKML
jgi:hypothetical protein